MEKIKRPVITLRLDKDTEQALNDLKRIYSENPKTKKLNQNAIISIAIESLRDVELKNQ